MIRTAIVVSLVVACSTQEAVQTKWLELPMAAQIQVPANATMARHSESPDRDAPPGAIVSARECVLVVLPGSRGDLGTQEAEIVETVSKVTIDRREPPGSTGSGLFVGYHYPSGDKTLRSFRYEVTLGESTFNCSPFNGRPDVSCEERACRSLKSR